MQKQPENRLKQPNADGPGDKPEWLGRTALRLQITDNGGLGAVAARRAAQRFTLTPVGEAPVELCGWHNLAALLGLAETTLQVMFSKGNGQFTRSDNQGRDVTIIRHTMPKPEKPKKPHTGRGRRPRDFALPD